jgi:hypothetical protein
MTVLRCGLLVAVVGAVAVLLTSAGCGHRAAPPAPKAKPAAKQSVPLPDWAPANPSPQFLRAARVLRGVPMDVVGRGDVPEQTWRAMLAYMKRVNPTLWELFGSMSDDQIDRFLVTKRASLPVRSLTPGQRAALDAVLDANKGNETEIAGVTLGDFRTLLYKMGARHDLSNVTIGFAIEGANTLSFNARVAGNKDPLEWTGWAQAPRLGPKRPAERPASHAKESIPLPDWAPRNPSPEFLRAAKVLKPLPREVSERQTSNVGPGLTEALKARVERILYPASYRMFGALSDEQMEHFLGTKEIRLPVRAMTKAQRAAFDDWFSAAAEAFKGGPPEYADVRVYLYKLGAKEDLSNVEAGFVAVGGHAVHIWFWVRGRDGKEGSFDTYFAEI